MVDAKCGVIISARPYFLPIGNVAGSTVPIKITLPC